MKRACFVFVAVLAVLLVYPATLPSAKTPGIDGSSIIGVITPSPHGQGGALTPSGTGNGDSGDADDLGLKGDGHREGSLTGTSRITAPGSRFGANIWWMYLWFHRIF